MMKKLLSTLERLKPPTPASSCSTTPIDANLDPPRTPDRESRSEEDPELTPQSPFTQQQSSLRPVPFREHSSSSISSIHSVKKNSSSVTPAKPPSLKRRSIPRVQFLPPPTQLEILTFRCHHGVNLDSIFSLQRDSSWGSLHANEKLAGGSDAVCSYALKHGVPAARSKLESHWKESLSEEHWQWLADEAGVTTVRITIDWPSFGPAWCDSTPFESIKEAYLDSYALLKRFISAARKHEIGVILDIKHPPLQDQGAAGTSLGGAFWKYPKYRTVFTNLLTFVCQQTLNCPIMSQAVVGLQFLHESNSGLLESPEQDANFHEWYDHIIRIIYTTNPRLPLYVPSVLDRKGISGSHSIPIWNDSYGSYEAGLGHTHSGLFRNLIFPIVQIGHRGYNGYQIEKQLSCCHDEDGIYNRSIPKRRSFAPGFFWDYNPQFFPQVEDPSNSTHHNLLPTPPPHLILPISNITHLRTHALSKKITSKQSASVAYKRSLNNTKTRRLSIEEEPQTHNRSSSDDCLNDFEALRESLFEENLLLVSIENLTESYADGWDLGFTDALAFWGGDCVAGNCGGGDRIGPLDYWIKKRVYGNGDVKGNGNEFCFAEVILKEVKRYLDSLQLDEADKERENMKEHEKAYAKVRAYEKGMRDGICDFEFVVGLCKRNSWGGKGGSSGKGSK